MYNMYNMSTQPHIQLAGTVTVGPKGQVVIPADVREKMGIASGDKLIALFVESKQSVAFVSEDQFQSIVDKFGAHLSDMQKIIKKS